MSNTFTQIHIHVVFAVKHRYGLLLPSWRERLFAYIASIIDHAGHKSLLVNGVEDHVHLVFGMRPTQPLAELIKTVKQASSRWVNDSGFVPGKFAWQEGYGAFSCGYPDLPGLLNYVAKQEEHHQRIRFVDEYRALLDEAEISYDERFLFHEPLVSGSP